MVVAWSEAPQGSAGSVGVAVGGAARFAWMARSLSGPISRLVGLYGCIAGTSHSGASCAVSVIRIGSSSAWWM